MIESYKSKQFLLFILTGGTAAALNFGSRIVFSQWFNLSTAIVLAYLVGMVTAFVLAKLFVFKDSQQSTHRAIMFLFSSTWLPLPRPG